jgi:hypothetical protein
VAVIVVVAVAVIVVVAAAVIVVGVATENAVAANPSWWDPTSLPSILRPQQIVIVTVKEN